MFLVNIVLKYQFVAAWRSRHASVLLTARYDTRARPGPAAPEEVRDLAVHRGGLMSHYACRSMAFVWPSLWTCFCLWSCLLFLSSLFCLVSQCCLACSFFCTASVDPRVRNRRLDLGLIRVAPSFAPVDAERPEASREHVVETPRDPSVCGSRTEECHARCSFRCCCYPRHYSLTSTPTSSHLKKWSYQFFMAILFGGG